MVNDETMDFFNGIVSSDGEEAPLTAVSETLSLTLEGVPPDVRKTIEGAINIYGEDLSDITDKDTLLRKEEDKIAKIRHAYNVLADWLINNKINELNRYQKLFLNTGAMCDVVEFKETGTVTRLLDTDLYKSLLYSIDDTVGLPPWASQIYRVEDKFKIIANLTLPPIGLDGKGRKLYMEKQQKKGGKTDIGKLKDLTEKKNLLSRDMEELISQTDMHLIKYYDYVKNIPAIQSTIKNIKRFRELMNIPKHSEEDSKELHNLVENNIFQAGHSLVTYADGIIETMKRLKNIASIDKKIFDLKDVHGSLSQMANTEFDRSNKLLIDDEALKHIKSDVSFISGYAMGGARTSPVRIPESTTRTLLDVHSAHVDDPMQSYCTIKNVSQSMGKILKIHTNLFPYDDKGKIMIPPIIIEPIRNYTDWFEDRFVISFVSGEPTRKGPKYSFTSVDFHLLKACGQYLCKDRVFDYRGDRLTGTFMADYSGKVESKTAVKWTGDDKKLTLIATSKEVDSASREEAVKDYIDFIFNMSNDFPPPISLSKRKIAIMLRYIILESLEKTIALLLKYVADREPEEAKAILMYYAEDDKYRAGELIKGAAEVDPVVAAEGVTSYLRKLFTR